MKSAHVWKKELTEYQHGRYTEEGIKAIQSDTHQSGVLEGLRLAVKEANKEGLTTTEMRMYSKVGATLSWWTRIEQRITSLAEQIKSQGVK